MDTEKLVEMICRGRIVNKIMLSRQHQRLRSVAFATTSWNIWILVNFESPQVTRTELVMFMWSGKGMEIGPTIGTDKQWIIWCMLSDRIAFIGGWPRYAYRNSLDRNDRLTTFIAISQKTILSPINHVPNHQRLFAKCLSSSSCPPPPWPQSLLSPTHRPWNRRSAVRFGTLRRRLTCRARQRTFEAAYWRTALGQFSFALILLSIFQASFYPIGGN